MSRCAPAALLAMAAAAFASCGEPTALPPPAQPATLEGLVQAYLDAHDAQDAPRMIEIMFSVIPTSAELRSCLKSGPDADAFLAAYKGKDLARNGPEVAGLAKGLFVRSKPTQTEIHVYSATTEELVAYAEGTEAFAQFPRGMQRFAQKVAAPGRTWHVVTIVEPGQRLGMKYTCMTRVGGRFVLVAKPWRLVPRDPRETPNPEPNPDPDETK